MDPNETLRLLREMVRNADESDLIAEAFANLDDWLSKGGFLPDDWAQFAELVGWVSVSREQFVPREGLEPGRFNVYRISRERGS